MDLVLAVKPGGLVFEPTDRAFYYMHSELRSVVRPVRKVVPPEAESSALRAANFCFPIDLLPDR